MLSMERRLWSQGFHLLAGIDEVGRGCLAGPVVASAVVFPIGVHIEGVKDSKQLSAGQRDKLNSIIIDRSICVAFGLVEAHIVDEINIKQAARLAMKRAVTGLRFCPDYLLVDAENVDLPLPQESIIKGDCKSHSIAAASIAAKVYRDRLCKEWDSSYPEYKFGSNKGYYTREHREALEKHGPCPLHRKTFIQGIVKDQSFEQIELFSLRGSG